VGRRSILAVALLSYAPTSLPASEPALHRNPQTGQGTRALALAGAFVALADDESALGLNPAGLVSVPRSLEAQLSGWSSEDQKARPLRFAGAFHPTRRLATGFSLGRLPADEVRSLPESLAAPVTSTLDEYAFGVAYQPNRRVSAGATFLWQQLKLPGTAAKDGAPGFAAGILYRPPQADSPRLALRYTHRTTWQLGEAGAVSVRSPSVLSAGAAWRYDSPTFIRRVTLSVQPDYVRYSELGAGDAQGTTPRDEIDLRAGIELSLPFGCWTGCGSMVQLRAGLVNASDAAPLAPLARDGSQRGRETLWALGASLALRRFHGRVKLDVAYERRLRTFMAGVGWRFPAAYRSDIEDASRR
jgi:hypothetical protein